MGDALKYLRIFNGYKSAQLAEELGLSQSYISELENNKKQPSIEVLDKYAKFFNMKKSTLMLFSESLESDKVKMKQKQRVAYIGMKLLQIMEKVGELDIE